MAVLRLGLASLAAMAEVAGGDSRLHFVEEAALQLGFRLREILVGQRASSRSCSSSLSWSPRIARLAALRSMPPGDVRGRRSSGGKKCGSGDDHQRRQGEKHGHCGGYPDVRRQEAFQRSSGPRGKVRCRQLPNCGDADSGSARADRSPAARRGRPRAGGSWPERRPVTNEVAIAGDHETMIC